MSDADSTTIDDASPDTAGAEPNIGAETEGATGTTATHRAGATAQRAGEVLTDVAGNVASTVSRKAPVVIEVSRTTAGKAAREVQGASSDDLRMGTVFSTGLALGLLLARAPRLLVLVALAPVLVFGGTLLARKAGVVPPRGSGSGTR